MTPRTAAELIVPILPRNITIVTGMVEQAAAAFGLDKAGTFNMVFAAEELFNVLSSGEGPDDLFRVVVRDGGYYVETACYFPPRQLPVTALNTTTAPNPDDESFVDNLGIIIAARVVDRLRLVSEPDGNTGMYFTIEKSYPALTTSLGILSVSRYTIRSGSREEIKQFAARVLGTYGMQSPEFFRFPGKVVDMVGSNEYGIQLAVDEKGNVGGGMLWRWSGKMIDALGPFVFLSTDGLAGEIVEHALAQVSRRGAVCMVIRSPVRGVPPRYFEELHGDSTPGHPLQPSCPAPLYRQLDEDTGSVVYVHPDLESFVKGCYERLVLPRQIIVSKYAGESLEPHVALGVSVDRKQYLAVISPIVVGKDFGEVLAQYIASLQAQGITRFEFELDLGDDTTPVLVPALREAGFVPCYVLPWGGKGDVAVFGRESPRGS